MSTPRYQYRVSYRNSAQGGSCAVSRHRSIEAARAAAERLNRRIRNDGYAHSYAAEYYEPESGWLLA